MYHYRKQKKWFDQNLENLGFRWFYSKEKWLLYNDIQDKILNRVKETRDDKIKYYNHSKKLSNGQKAFITEYFKTHEFNRKNLWFVCRYIDTDWWYINERIDLAIIHLYE